MNMLWSVRYRNHLYVLWRGELIYKNWDDPEKKDEGHPSILFNKGWPSVWIIDNEKK